MNTPPQLNQPVPPGTYGGVFLARPAQGRDDDRELIEAEGWTVVEETPRAGQTEFLVFGSSATAGQRLAAYSDDNAGNRFALPAYLFLLPIGEVLTLGLIKLSVPMGRDQVAF